MSTILICGATGFIGRNLTERLAANPRHEVHAVSHQSQQFNLDGVTWHDADLRNPNHVEEVVAGKEIIIQAAATTSGANDIVNRPYIHVTDNAVMNSYLFRSAYENNAKQVIFFSCTVMYPSSEIPLKEDDLDENLRINENYFGVGNTKVYLEKMCEFYSGIGNTKFTAIRHSNIYGPHDKFDLERSHVFGATITKVMTAQDKITVWGAGEESRDLLYVGDLVDFVLLAIGKQSNKFELFNCGYGSAITVRELVEKIIRYSERELSIEYDPTKPTIKGSVTIDNSHAKKILGWSPMISLDEGIQKTLQWWKNEYLE